MTRSSTCHPTMASCPQPPAPLEQKYAPRLALALPPDERRATPAAPKQPRQDVPAAVPLASLHAYAPRRVVQPGGQQLMRRGGEDRGPVGLRDGAGRPVHALARHVRSEQSPSDVCQGPPAPAGGPHARFVPPLLHGVERRAVEHVGGGPAQQRSLVLVEDEAVRLHLAALVAVAVHHAIADASAPRRRATGPPARARGAGSGAGRPSARTRTAPSCR